MKLFITVYIALPTSDAAFFTEMLIFLQSTPSSIG